MNMTVVKKEPMDSGGGQGHSNDIKMETAGADGPFAQGNDDDVEDDGEDVFEVERVVGHSVDPITKNMRYFIKWKGYTIQDNTWEPQQAVFAHSLISEYWDRYVKGGGKKSDFEGRDPLPPSRKAISKVPKAGQGKSTGADLLFQEMASSSSTALQGKEQSLSSSITPTTPAIAPTVVPAVTHAIAAPAVVPTPSVAPVSAPTVAPTVTPTTGSSPVHAIAPTVIDTSATKTSTGGKHSSPSATSRTTNPIKKARTTSPTPTSLPTKTWTSDQDPYKAPLDLPSWEELVKQVDSVENRDGVLIVHILWYNGRRSEHTNMVVRKKCPVKLVVFYESMLQFAQES